MLITIDGFNVHKKEAWNICRRWKAIYLNFVKNFRMALIKKNEATTAVAAVTNEQQQWASSKNSITTHGAQDFPCDSTSRSTRRYRTRSYKLLVLFFFMCTHSPNTTKSIWPVKIELALDSRIYVLDIKQCQFNYSGGFCHLYQLSHSTHYITASTTFTPPHPLPQRYYIITRIQIQWIICYQFLFARSFARSHSHILPLRIALHALVGYCFFAFVLIFIYFRISEMFPLPKKALQVFFLKCHVPPSDEK